MTTSTNTPRLTYLTSDGSTVNFTFNFSIADQNSIAVYVATTLKTLTTDYTVAFDSGTSGTGTVTLVSAPAINTKVFLIRDTHNARATDFAQGGAFLAATINNELDRITQGIQDVDNIVADKVIRVAEPTVETATLTIPAAATRASKLLGFDASGNVSIINQGSGTVDSVGLSTSDANITLGGTNPVVNTGTITINLTSPLVKNLTGDVTGNVTAASGTSTFNNLIVNGDLTVEGTTTTVNTATLDVEDNIIRLATNQSGAPSVNAGIEVERGSSADKSLVWNETTDKWTVGSETFVAGTVEANVTGNLTGNVTGNADTATYASAVTLTADNTTNATNYLLFSNAASGNQSPRTDTGLTYNPGTNTLAGGTFSGVFSGTLTGANDFITVVGDDSTGVNVTLGETIKIAGGSNITTSVSGDTLTINGSNPAQGLTFVGDDSTGTIISDGETVKIAGGNNITTAMSGDILTITGSKTIDVNEINSGDSSAIQINDAVNISGTLNAKTIVTNDLISEDSSAINVLDGMNVSGTLSADVLDVNELSSNDSTAIQINDAVNISGAATINNTLAVTSTSTFTGDATFLGSIKGDTNSPVTIAPDGTGDVHINADSLRIGDNNTDATIATRGTGDLILTTNEGSGTEGTIRLYDGANGNITVTPNGTGDVQLVADTVQIGDSNANATLTTNGTGDIIINTNSGTNSGSITIEDAANGNMKILVNGTGKIDLVQELNVTNFPFTPAVDNTNLAPYDSPTYVGSRTLYSNLTQGNITDPAERVRANTRFVAIKHPNDSTTYSDSDYVIQNTDITVVDINGQSFAHTSRGASARGEANNVFMLNTAGGTKTGPNMNGGGSFVEISEGHGGDLTCSNAMGFRSLISNRADTGEFTRMTNAYGFLSEGIGTGGTGANGTNRFVTNEYGFFSQGATGTSLVTNYYGFYVNTGANATNRFGVYVNNSAYSNLLGGLTIVNNAISSTGGGTITIASAANGAITLAPNGTGDVNMDADTVRIGDSNATATLTTNGTGDLTLSTNAGSNSGTITITQGANANITLQPNGTGDVILSADTVQVGDSAAAATITSNGAGNLILQTGSSPTGNITITQGANANISITPDGTGDVILSADTVQVGDSNSTATITTNGTGTLSLSTNNGTNSGTIQIASGANGAITIAPNGTGDVLLSADTVQIGDSNADATITTTGTGDLILNTNSGSSSGSITIADGVNGNISILNNGTGELVVSGAITTSGATDLVLDTNAGSNSGSITIADGVNGDITVVTNGTGTVNFSDDIVRQATLKDYAETIYAIGNSGSGTITPDVTNGNVQTITATDNFTLALPSNIPTGGSLTLIITQDGTGGRTCTFDSGYKFANAFKTLTGTASSIDVVVIFYTGSVYLASLNINFS